MRFMKVLTGLAVATAMAASGATTAVADNFNIKLATGHPPAFHYVKWFGKYFAPELKRRVEDRTDHTMLLETPLPRKRTA